MTRHPNQRRAVCKGEAPQDRVIQIQLYVHEEEHIYDFVLSFQIHRVEDGAAMRQNLLNKLHGW